MPACCICYTTDPAYLFPTFVSAIQARRYAAIDKADVAIFGFDIDASAQNVFRSACEAEGIRFFSAGREVIDGAPVMLSRLFLTRFVPGQYSQFIYIDGDTQILASLDPLIDMPTPTGKFLAADDPMTFALPGTGSHSRGIEEHFSAIGLTDYRLYSYFNTGVLRINREGWERIGSEAWELFSRQAQASRFPDQDVLNLTGGRFRIPMSLAWNFPIFMRNSRVETEISPRIYHFMSNPKPWQGVFPPWGATARTPYIDVVKKYPDLAGYDSVMPAGRRFRYHLQQRYKKALETFTWGLSSKRTRILDYERRVGEKLRAMAP